MSKAVEEKRSATKFKELLNQDLDTSLKNIINKGVDRFNNFYEEISHLDYDDAKTNENKDIVDDKSENEIQEENNDNIIIQKEEKLMEKFKTIENKLISCMSVKNNVLNDYKIEEKDEVNNQLKNSIDLEKEHENLNKELQERFKSLNCIIDKNKETLNKKIDENLYKNYFEGSEDSKLLRKSTNSFSSISNKQKLKPISSSKIASSSLYSTNSLNTKKSEINSMLSQTCRNNKLNSKNNSTKLKANKQIEKLSNKVDVVITNGLKTKSTKVNDQNSKLINENNEKNTKRNSSINKYSVSQPIKIPVFNETNKFSLVKLQEKREERKQKLVLNQKKSDLFKFNFKYNVKDNEFEDQLLLFSKNNNINKDIKEQ